MHPPQRLLSRLFGLEQKAGPGVGIDAEDDLVRLRDRAPADPDLRRALEDHAHLGDLLRQLLAGADEEWDPDQRQF